MIPPTHKVTIAIGNANRWGYVPQIRDYDFSSDMMEATDAFSLQLPTTSELWALSKPDNAINVFIDNIRVYSGIIDDRIRRLSKAEGSLIQINGRDKVGRLVDESAPLIQFAGLGIVDLAQKLCEDLLSVTTSNATNRRLIAGGASRKVTSEPPIERGKQAPKKVDPGETRWQVLQHFLEESGLLAWATADGSGLVIGKPNYTQSPLWSFLVAKPNSSRAHEHNVMDLDYRDALAERYSTITAVGATKGSKSSYGSGVTQNRGTATNGPGPDGIGKDFRLKKRLIVQDDGIHSPADAAKRAVREMAERDSHGKEIILATPGHGQREKPGGPVSLFTFDTIARVDDEEIDEAADWYVTGVRYSGDRSAGQRTTLRMIPVGSDLRMGGQ